MSVTIANTLDSFGVYSPSSYCDEYQTVYNAMTNKPTKAIAEAQNTMVESLVDDGIWSKLDVFYLFAQYSNSDGEALLNWLAPTGDDNATNNSASFTSLEGFTGNGTSHYINTNWNPATEGSNFTQNSASVFYYSRANTSGTRANFGAATSGHVILDISTTSGSITYQHLNDSGSTNNVNATFGTAGFYVYNRASSESFSLYQNNSEIGSTAYSYASVTPPSANMIVLACDDNSTIKDFSSAQLAVFGAGSSLDATERGNLQTAIETYMDSNSKGIIS